MVRSICKITVTLNFIFRLVLYSHEDVLFNILTECVGRHLTVLLVNVLQEKKTINTVYRRQSKCINENVKL